MDVKSLLPLSGIVFVALVVLSVGIGGGTPASDAPSAKVAAFYDEHEIRQAISAFVIAASVPFLVFFGVGLAATLEAREAPLWGRVLIAGTILAAGAIAITAFVHFALVDGANSELSPEALQALNALDGNTWLPLSTGLGVMMLGAAGALPSAGVVRWLDWAALVLGVGLFVPFADFIAMLLTAVWIVVAALALRRRRLERHDPTVATTA